MKASEIVPVAPFLPSTAIAYRVPAFARKLTLLVLSKAVVSSFEPTRTIFENVHAPEAGQAYIAITVSKVLPEVEKLYKPLAPVGGVNEYHTELAAVLPACAGSPGSAVASVLEPRS